MIELTNTQATAFSLDTFIRLDIRGDFVITSLRINKEYNDYKELSGQLISVFQKATIELFREIEFTNFEEKDKLLNYWLKCLENIDYKFIESIVGNNLEEVKEEYNNYIQAYQPKRISVYKYLSEYSTSIGAEAWNYSNK